MDASRARGLRTDSKGDLGPEAGAQMRVETEGRVLLSLLASVHTTTESSRGKGIVSLKVVRRTALCVLCSVCVFATLIVNAKGDAMLSQSGH